MLEQAIQEYVNTNKSARQVAKEFGISKDRLTNVLNKRGLMRPKKDNSYNKEFFKYIDSEEKAYWLGFIYADGSITHTKSRNVLEIVLKNEDRDHLYKFKKAIQYKGDIKDKSVGNYKACRISLYGEDLVKDLINLGATPRKSFTLTFPTYLDLELQRHFIRGYYDGDGSVYIYEKLNKISISILGTEQFLTRVQDIFIRDLHITRVKIYDHRNIKEYKKSRKQALKILDYLYKDCTLYLERKFNKYAHLTQSLEKC